ncbi:uncharacterized protein LOC143300314 [Babylonia areolata]|uniref:uncharacterized protein LOC143300314 n=1 Tax=Babylonia areolata TaxID=304850 RepID=UPI003FD3559F
MPPVLTVCFFMLAVPVAFCSKGCDRSNSRLVRKVVREKLLPAFVALNTELSDECLFSLGRDRYGIQETHKSVEDGVNWYCHFCGKAFMTEYYLDLHFENRHSDQLQVNGVNWYCHFCGKAFMTEYYLDLHFENRHSDQLQMHNSVCLADMCEVFRCDVIGRRVVADFWDVALCLEDDMKILHHKCSLMVKSCVPSGLTENETRRLTDQTMKELCSYLTCSKYWEIPFDARITDGSTGLYIIMVVMVIFCVIIYYFIFFAYFYTDAFSDTVIHNSVSELGSSTSSYRPKVRHRHHRFSESHPD